MKSPSFYISELFESIQGEGNCAGVNSLFIRFQHCNLTCSWCDTKFTWGKDEQLKPLGVDEVKSLIQSSASPNVIFTGGEPTLYALDKLVLEGKRFHVETNGSIVPTEALEMKLKDGSLFTREAMDEAVIRQFNWVVSPKMSNAQQELNAQAISYWASKNYCIFKFIIQNTADLIELADLVNQYKIDKQKVYIGLEGNSIESQLRPELVDEIIAAGYNYSPRLHVLLWGNERKK